MKAKFACTLLLPIVLGGCTTTDPYTGEEKVNNTTKGAAIGAATGAAVAAIANKDTKSGKRSERILAAAAGGGHRRWYWLLHGPAGGEAASRCRTPG